MKDAVLIKSFPNGIVLHLSEADTFEEILQETAIRFRESRDFTGTYGKIYRSKKFLWKLHHGTVYGGAKGDRSRRNSYFGYHPREQQCQDRLYCRA